VETLYRVTVTCGEREEGVVRAVLMRHVNSQPGMTIQGLATQDAEQAGKAVVVAEVFSGERNDKYLNDLVSRLSIEPGVSAVRWERLS
jgi:putative Mg2+ transporter-C (MgtC) family protein